MMKKIYFNKKKMKTNQNTHTQNNNALGHFCII